ncbi:hypothetical protein SADUNF_Sadunf16G0261400 [Salix dunnii]|uniref:Uncharacterized protein n=1 Tax=Salix dunnii TaxID=1413687 RepID=A0A835J8U5_9ROSI|nr:hypothetical protein SADUNF_Sadunf16G0261400 [Salix dunnii]
MKQEVNRHPHQELIRERTSNPDGSQRKDAELTSQTLSLYEGNRHCCHLGLGKRSLQVTSTLGGAIDKKKFETTGLSPANKIESSM